MRVKRRLSSVIAKDELWYVTQCLEVDVVSRCGTETEASAKLREGLKRYFESPMPIAAPHIAKVEVEVRAA